MNLKFLNIKILLIICFNFLSFLISMVPIEQNNAAGHHWLFTSESQSGRVVGEFDFPSDPMNDRARGYLLKGKAQSAITNYGRFIDWDHHPPGLWGNYTYLPAVGFVAGIPGQSYTYNYTWVSNADEPDFCTLESDGDYIIWCSEDAYYDQSGIGTPGFSWYEGDPPNESQNANYVSVVFDAYNDDGILGQKLCSPYEVDNQNECVNGIEDFYTGEVSGGCIKQCNIEDEDDLSVDEEDCYNECYDACITCYDENNEPSFEICNFDDKNQFCVHDENELVMISLDYSDEDFTIDPNKANVYDTEIPRGVGFVYPWAMRPALDKRLSDFDLYEYGDDKEEWTKDDEYDYYGSNTAESWFTRYNPSVNTDWHASEDSRLNTHTTNVDESDIFGNINYLNITSSPVLAHSDAADTWPLDYNEDGELVPTWPGWFAESYSPDIGKSGTGCYPKKRYNDDCWITTNRFISDSDIYMEFDDRWAHRGNMVNNNEYQQTGYPMGLRVMAEAHSYGISFAEDILFVTVQVRNESGDGWCAFTKDKNGYEIDVLDNNGDKICGNAMVMPDGTKLNAGKGFTYKGTSMGFYMDADVVTSNRFGNFGVHTNEDDFMEYYDCKLEPEGCDFINDDFLRVSIAMIYDYDFSSGSASDIGIVATQLLDSPFATEEVQLTNEITIAPGEKLKMTDWHWFSWYNRPGVVFSETSVGYAGDPGKSQARNKEDIMYKVLSGDTTNLSQNERDWFFHTPNPSIDDHEGDLNPHFDSLDGLAQTSFFLDNEDGLDCVLQMSSGPFSLEVGEQAPFSFCVIWGQNKEDLLENAKFAQLMYNSHYQGYTAPDTPTLSASIGDENDNEEWYSGQHHCINLSWDDVAENSSDVVSGYSDFEGYNIYRSNDGGISWGDSAADLYDSTDPDSWFPYATYHLTAEEDINHCTFSNDYHQECSNTFPMYYVENDCFLLCEDNLIDEDELLDCFSSSDDSNFNLAWETCISDNCGTCAGTEYPYWQTIDAEDTCSGGTGSFEAITVYDYSTVLQDDEQGNYAPIYGKTNCNYSPWCTGKTCADSEDIDSRLDDDHIRGYDVCGKDDNNAIAGSNALGECHDPGSDEDEIGLKHSFTDCNVIDGMEYTYAVTAFDTGIPKSYITEFDSEYGIYNQSVNTANPLAFASPYGYESIQTSRGRSTNEKNFVTIEAGAKPSRNISKNIKAVPNPYIVHSGFNNETEYSRSIRFTHLPEKCRITIFTISGEKVISFIHDDRDDGNAWWNVRTVNNQEVAPGLYVFAVENLIPGYENEKFIGKFAVVR